MRAKVTSEVVYLDASGEEPAVIASSGENIDENGYFVSERVSVRSHLRASEVDRNEVTHIDASRRQIIGSSAGLIPFY